MRVLTDPGLVQIARILSPEEPVCGTASVFIHSPCDRGASGTRSQPLVDPRRFRVTHGLSASHAAISGPFFDVPTP